MFISLPPTPPSDKQYTTNTSGNEEYTQPQPQAKTSSSSMLQRHHRAKDFSEQATNILSAAWRKNTKVSMKRQSKDTLVFVTKGRLTHTIQMIS